MKKEYVILLLAIIPLSFGIANAVDFTITRNVGDSSNAVLIENSLGVDQFWIDSNGFAYHNGTQIELDIHNIGNVTSFGCAEGEVLKVNGTGWGCGADDSSGSPADIHTIGNVTSVGCATGQFLTVSGTNWACTDSAGGEVFTWTNHHDANEFILKDPTYITNGSNVLTWPQGASQTLLGNQSSIHDLVNVTATGCASGQVLTVSGSSWGCGTSSGSDILFGPDFIIYQDGSDTVALSNTGTEQARSTDDDSVIQNAITNLPEDGGIVFITAGDYTIDSTIVFNANNQRVIGAGALTTKLNFEGTAVDPVFAMTDTTQRVNLEIAHLRLNQTQDWDIDGTGINMTKFALSHVHDVRIDNVDVGIAMHGIQTYYNLVERVDIFNVDLFGITIDETSNENTLNRIRIAPETTATGVFCDNSNGIDMYFVDVENGVSGAAIGIHIGPDCHGVNIISTYLDNNTENLQLDSGVEGVMVTGKISGGSPNIDDDGCVHCIIEAWVEFEPYINSGMAYNRAATLTAVSNAVSSTSCFIQINTSSGAVTLDEVNDLPDGCLVIIKSNSSSNPLTISEGGPACCDFQLASSADVTISNSQDFFIGFHYDGVGIFEIARAENN